MSSHKKIKNIKTPQARLSYLVRHTPRPHNSDVGRTRRCPPIDDAVTLYAIAIDAVEGPVALETVRL